MKTKIASLLFCLACISTFAQSPNPWETKLQAAKTDTAKIRICINAGEAYIATRSNFDSANYFYQKGVSINNKVGTNKLTALLFLRLGNFEYHMQNYHQADLYYRESQKIAQQLHDNITYQKATFNMINVSTGQAFYARAIKQLLAFDRTMNNKTSQDSIIKRILYGNLSECYQNLEDKQKCYFYMQKMLPYCKTPKDSLIYNNMKFKWNSTFNNLLDANAYSNIIRLSEKLNFPSAKIGLIVNLSSYYVEQNQYDKAIAAAQKAIKMVGNMPELENIKMYAYVNILKAYTGKKQYQIALEYQMKITDYLEKDIRLKYIAYKELVTIYTHLGNYKKAYEYSNKIIAHEEKVKGDRNKQAVAEIDAEIEAQVKQELLSKSELDAKLKQERINVAQQQKTIVIVLLILSLCLLLWALWSFQKQKTLNKLLNQQKQQLEAQTKELSEANQTKDKIFAVISHDLKSPINGLKAILTLFHSKDISVSKMKELIQTLTTKIEIVQGIMSNLLQWSLQELKHQPFSYKVFPITSVIEKVVIQLQAIAEQKQITLQTSLIPVQIEANLEDFEIIVRNILYNSIKFTPKGGVIRLSIVEQENQIAITCTDTGIGITQNTLDEIRHLLPTPKVGTAGEIGSGLGLKISQELIQRNKGSIRIESEINKGTDVIMFFPKFHPLLVEQHAQYQTFNHV